MSALGRGVAAGLVPLALLIVVAILSQLPLRGESPEEAALRLSWRLRGEEAGECPQPTPEELARLPVHMRNPDACLGPMPPYRLRLWVDDVLRVDTRVEGAGARGDRPLYVLEEVRLGPGSHALRVDFRREEGDLPLADPGTALEWEGSLVLQEGTVMLVTRASDTGELELRRPR